jgi:hypothetical protein
MYLETGNEAYINQTVIYGDGDDVVTITEGEIFQEFCGFKITHSGGGSGMLIQNRPVYIHHLNFHYNMSQKGAGIYIEEGEPLIEYCTFSENFLSGDGGTVYSDNAQPLLYNLTFYNNYADDGSAIMAVNNSDVTAKNLIVWGNEENTLVADETSQLAVTYSNLQEMQAGEGIISTDPLFANPAVYDLALLAGSPCIDSGDPDTDGDGINWETDTGDQEPDGTRRDMGGKFHNQNNPAVNNEIAAAPDVIVFPNPWFVTSSRQNLRISWNLEAAGFAEMDIYNIKGQLLNRQIFAPGALSACWNGRDRNGQPAATGVYFFNLKSENINHTRKFLLVR